TPKSASANQGNPRAKGIVASSAATLVSDRAYRPQPFPQSTTNFKKLRENRKWLFLNGYFRWREKSSKASTNSGPLYGLSALPGIEVYMVNAAPLFKGPCAA
ncbi:hypothetical protein, partial [Sinorhizobium medicae]|uniref:hypothetical protein n=1 Tax=Sinorhizobium medicae TaxID=110321 RepID=UPI002B1BDF7C